MRYPEDKIENTDPIRYDMCKYIRAWEWVNFGFRDPNYRYFSKEVTDYTVAVLLKLDKAPDYIRVAVDGELTRPYFIFSYMDYETLDNLHFDVPLRSFIGNPLPKLDNPGGEAMYIDNFCSGEI